MFNNIGAQVTIGSGIPPADGALLDLKEKTPANPATDNATATKGLLLPRVKLTDPGRLYPMFNGNYNPGEDVIHTGLTVLNLSECDGKFAKGVYTWTGGRWEQLTNNPVLSPAQPPAIDIPNLPAGNMVHIPGGMDARGTDVETTLVFTWTGQEAIWSDLTDAVAGSISSGLKFANAGSGITPGSVSAGTGSWTAPGTSTLTLKPDNLSSLATVTNPWVTRQSSIKITVPSSPSSACGTGGPAQGQTVILNQTNYKIIASSDPTSNNPPANTHITSPVMLRNNPSVGLHIHSNVQWTATPAQGSGMSFVLNTHTKSGGTDKANGTKGQSQFTYAVAAGRPGSRFKTADMIFQDAHAPKRAPDLAVTFMQCQGSPDMGKVATSSTPSETSGADVWGSSIVHHQAKRNVYKEFYSARFGTAGRWMITNLSATAYDGITHPYRNLQGPAANTRGDRNTAYWCYPSGIGPMSSAEYDVNPHLGYLYTWDAATAGKGGRDGTGNVNNAGGATNNESGFPPGTGRNQQKQVQGVCPKGWHLPSDYEWFLLEKEIIRNTTAYAGSGTAINAAETDGSASGNMLPIPPAGSDGQTNLRGPAGLGSAMKDMCTDYTGGAVNSGVSYMADANGFSALLAGWEDSGKTNHFNIYGFFWTSSASSRKIGNIEYWDAWSRYVSHDGHQTGRRYLGREYMFSVRCKKD